MKHFTAIIAALAIVTVSASAQVIGTDSTWKVASTEPNSGWNTTNSFDDSSWANATELYQADNHTYIWDAGGLTGGADIIYLRKTFTLDQALESATLTTSVDDDFEFYINGTLVIADSSGNATSDFTGVNVLPHLTLGTNLLAARAINVTAPNHAFGANLTATPVPEPSTIVAAGIGLAALLRRRRRA